MNPNDIPIYAAISGIQMETEEFDFGHGVRLSKTFAHLMAPFLMAFAPPSKRGSHHPGPLSPVNGGLAYDIHVQLHVPENFALPEWFDRINTVWWLAALLRLRLCPSLSVPVVANKPFSEVPKNSEDAQFWPLEIHLSKLLPVKQTKRQLGISELQWVKNYWQNAGVLMRKSGDFNTAFQAFDQCTNAGSVALALLTLWGALEQLFSPAKQELRFRVSAAISSFLEPPGSSRLALHKMVLRLYDARSRAAHGSGHSDSDALIDTYALMQRILIKIIEKNWVPSREDLEELMFGVTDG